MASVSVVLSAVPVAVTVRAAAANPDRCVVEAGDRAMLHIDRGEAETLGLALLKFARSVQAREAADVRATVEP